MLTPVRSRTAAGTFLAPTLLLILALPKAAPAAGFHPPTPEHQWAVIGSPGNAPNQYLEQPTGVPRSRGGVAYEYAITRTEITARQWNEFVQAYTPFINPANRFDSRFFSVRFRPVFLPGNQVRYEMIPAAAEYPVEIGWRYAARYCNWLHNGKVNEAWAFESGAYETATFGDVGTLFFTDQVSHSPGARFWIPTFDEWYKAAYFDPHKNGANQPGYWLYPTTSDTAPISGLPEDGGETSAGVLQTVPQIEYPPTAAYFNVTSPWGLWDMSGGYSEWTEGVSQFADLPDGRLVMGSRQGDPNGWQLTDWSVGWPGIALPRSGYQGLRIASRVPEPAVFSGVTLWGVFSITHRRRT